MPVRPRRRRRTASATARRCWAACPAGWGHERVPHQPAVARSELERCHRGASNPHSCHIQIGAGIAGKDCWMVASKALKCASALSAKSRSGLIVGRAVSQRSPAGALPRFAKPGGRTRHLAAASATACARGWSSRSKHKSSRTAGIAASISSDDDAAERNCGAAGADCSVHPRRKDHPSGRRHDHNLRRKQTPGMRRLVGGRPFISMQVGLAWSRLLATRPARSATMRDAASSAGSRTQRGIERTSISLSVGYLSEGGRSRTPE